MGETQNFLTSAAAALTPEGHTSTHNHMNQGHLSSGYKVQDEIILRAY